MKRWDCISDTNKQFNDVDKFLYEINEVCKNHNMSITHEDTGGCFIIKKYRSDLEAWLNHASVDMSS